MPQKIQYIEENINEESGNFTKKISDDKKEFLDKREKVLYEKEKKKKEEQDKWEEQFRLISMQNFQARKLANEKKNAQYRPSSGMKELIEKKEEDKKFKIQEDYDMNDESNEEDEIIFGIKYKKICIIIIIYTNNSQFYFKFIKFVFINFIYFIYYFKYIRRR